jgi:hypothetical protein
LDGIAPGLGKMATGLEKAAQGQNTLTGASKAFLLTGIGAVIAAVGAALFALQAYFKGSEEGQNKLNKIVAVGSAIFEQFMNVVEALGKAIFDAIENPQQALKDFGALIKENITNRFEGLMELIPQLGKAINLLFQGEFAEAGKVAVDAVAKVGLGVENLTDKIKGFVNETGNLINQGIANGKKLADLQAQIDRDERKLVEDRAKTSLEVSKLRAQAIEQEGEARRKTIQEAIKLEEELSNREVAIAKTQAERAALNVKANGDDKDALDELAAARAKVSQAEQSAFDNTLKFKKELESLNEKEKKAEEDKAKVTAFFNAKKAEDDKKAEEDRLKAIDDAQKAEQARLEQSLVDYQNYVQGLINEKKRELLEGVISQEEYNQEIADLQIAANEVQLAIKAEFGVQDLAQEGAVIDAKISLKQKEADETARLERFKVDAVKNTLGQVASLFNKNSVAFKALASAQTLIQSFQSAQAVFTGMTSTIPGPVGVALGIAGAAAAIISGLANVAKINAVQLPKLAEGGVIDIDGKRHAQGGERVRIGNRDVAEVEGGESMVILKRGAKSSLLRNLSNINRMAGGIDFYGDRSPKTYLADGGFVSRSAGSQVSSFQNLSISEDLKKVKLVVDVNEISRMQGVVNRAAATSELS